MFYALKRLLVPALFVIRAWITSIRVEAPGEPLPGYSVSLQRFQTEGSLDEGLPASLTSPISLVFRILVLYVDFTGLSRHILPSLSEAAVRL